MRQSALAFALVMALLPLAAHANSGDTDTLWFWETETKYGWAQVPTYNHGNAPPKILRKSPSLTEQCGRLVGRLLLRDISGRRYSVFLEDACVRNGGKL